MRCRFLIALLFLHLVTNAGEVSPMVLPAPEAGTGKSLFQCLQERHTTRELVPGEISPAQLSGLLWAAYGVNRPATGHRTAPSAMNSQEVRVYAALPEGLYLYEPKAHRLDPVRAADLRRKASGQDFAKNAALILIYVADLPALSKAKPEERPRYAAIDTGCIVQNVYLYCAAEGLGTVVFEPDRRSIQSEFSLGPDQQIVLAQAVGKPSPPRPPSSGGEAKPGR